VITRVKICGLTRGRDVRAAVASGADAIGFVFAPGSKRVIAYQKARELASQVPAFVTRVGLCLDQDEEHVRGILKNVPLSLLQFHGRENAEFCRQFGLPYIKAISMGSGVNAQDMVEQAERDFPDAAALLMDSHKPGELGGTGRIFDWKQLRHAGQSLVLAGGLTPDNVSEAIRLVRPWAVDVSSGVEDAPGIKNPGAMRLFIEQVRGSLGD